MCALLRGLRASDRGPPTRVGLGSGLLWTASVRVVGALRARVVGASSLSLSPLPLSCSPSVSFLSLLSLSYASLVLCLFTVLSLPFRLSLPFGSVLLTFLSFALSYRPFFLSPCYRLCAFLPRPSGNWLARAGTCVIPERERALTAASAAEPAEPAAEPAGGDRG